jgi:hypothetical protein
MSNQANHNILWSLQPKGPICLIDEPQSLPLSGAEIIPGEPWVLIAECSFFKEQYSRP